jgi:hypothetical protein
MPAVTDNMGDDCGIEDNRSCVHSLIEVLNQIKTFYMNNIYNAQGWFAPCTQHPFPKNFLTENLLLI